MRMGEWEEWWTVGGQGAAGPRKLRVERLAFLASKTVIFGANPIGPHILVVKDRARRLLKASDGLDTVIHFLHGTSFCFLRLPVELER